MIKVNTNVLCMSLQHGVQYNIRENATNRFLLNMQTIKSLLNLTGVTDILNLCNFIKQKYLQIVYIFPDYRPVLIISKILKQLRKNALDFIINQMPQAKYENVPVL